MTAKDGKVIAITWEQHRRTVGVCAGLGIQLFELTYRGHRVARYLVLISRTIALLFRERPHVLLVQNPSLVLALVTLVFRPICRYRLVVDAHNEAVQPFIHTQWPIPMLAQTVLARATMTIVTNQTLAQIVSRAGGRPFVLPDCLPSVPIEISVAPPLTAQLDVMVIATYAPDEPIAAILDAASQLGSTFQFHITGNDKKLSSELRARVPSNVRLTGFLPEHDYWHLMARSHLILDLTLMPDCLVCGAYEALAMGRPMVLSDNNASRELFGATAVLSLPGADDIVQALSSARTRYAEFSAAVPHARESFEKKWQSSAATLTQLLNKKR